MRRWNGWGDDSVTYPLPAAGSEFLASALGPGIPPRDAAFEKVLATVPRSRLPVHPHVSVDPEARMRHACGQSLPDWIALRSGRVRVFPDGVAYPSTHTEVRELIRFAQNAGARIIPYGGGTSVVGHINPLACDFPTLTIDLCRLNRLRRLNEISLLATFEAGVAGPDLEAQLRARGYTLGHFPQSFEFSTLGGWIVTRSSGQQSMGYGRIERLFAGGNLESPGGTLKIPVFPASAAGPDLREVVLGSEGRLGILTEATVRIRSIPQQEEFPTVVFPDFEKGQDAVREIVQAGLPISMLRLSTATETKTTFSLAGHKRLIGAVERFLSMRGLREEKCMLLLGLSGLGALVKAVRREALGMARKHGGVYLGLRFGRKWRKERFRTPYLRNTLWEMGYAVDTLETATEWAKVPQMVNAVESALRSAGAEMERPVHVFTHLSHIYVDGSSIYTTYLYPIATDPDETLDQWQRLKAAASRAIISEGGTISHQHGVGEDHLPYISSEKGALGMAAISELCHCFDPERIMNPGKLFPMPDSQECRS